VHSAQASTEEVNQGPKNFPNHWNEKILESFSIKFDNPQLLECFLNSPPIEQIRFPLDYEWIRQNQFDNQQLQELKQLKPLEYPIMDMGNDVKLIC
jgi:hypothetical protein